MVVTDKLKGMVEKLRQDLNEVKGQVKATMGKGVLQVTMLELGDRRSQDRRISSGSGDASVEWLDGGRFRRLIDSSW